MASAAPRNRPTAPGTRATGRLLVSPESQPLPPVSQLGSMGGARATRATRRTQASVAQTAAGSIRPSQQGSSRGNPRATPQGSVPGTAPGTAPPPTATPQFAGHMYDGSDEDEFDEYEEDPFHADETEYRAAVEEYVGPERCSCFPNPSNGRIPSMRYDGIKCAHKSKYNMVGMDQKHARFFADNWGPPNLSVEPEVIKDPPYRKLIDYQRAHILVKAKNYYRKLPPDTPEEYYDEDEYSHEDEEEYSEDGEHAASAAPRTRAAVTRHTAALNHRLTAPSGATRAGAPQTPAQTRVPETDVKTRDLQRKLQQHRNQPSTFHGKIYDPIAKKMVVYVVSHDNEAENFLQGEQQP